MAFTSRIPTPPQADTSVGNLVYPTDLVTSSRNIYMNMFISEYSATSVQSKKVLTPVKNIVLPIPAKLNDQTTVDWQQASITSLSADAISRGASGIGQILHAGGAVNALGEIASVATKALEVGTGVTFNPFLQMLFKTQNFKSHLFQWVFSPNNQQDAVVLQTVLDSFKAAMLPTYVPYTLGRLISYPNVLEVKINIPTNGAYPFLYGFKPCAISSLAIDWSGGGIPSFHADGSASIVTVTMELREIELYYNLGQGSDGYPVFG